MSYESAMAVTVRVKFVSLPAGGEMVSPLSWSAESVQDPSPLSLPGPRKTLAAGEFFPVVDDELAAERVLRAEGPGGGGDRERRQFLSEGNLGHASC